MKNQSGTTHPTDHAFAAPRDALTGAASGVRAHAKALESLLAALLWVLLAQFGRPWRRQAPLPPTQIIPGQRHAPGRAPHALAFALRLVPDWIFTPRNRGARRHARTASTAPRPASRDPP